MNSSEKILVTGCSGFIGMHLCHRLIREGYKVFGIDNMNDYYDVSLKIERLKLLKVFLEFQFSNVDISDKPKLDRIFKDFKPDKVVNLAGQASVPYSIKNPMVYIQPNIVGFMNILEICRALNVEGLIYASSSSVYGGSKNLPFSEKDNVDKPISIYAASKKANELMAHAYSHLFNLNTTGLRFFTVYGPWGRPDMAIYIFSDKISKGKSISVFNHGDMLRDFTYIDDIIDGLVSSLKKNYKCEIFNLGNNKSEKLMDVINIIETSFGKVAEIQFKDMREGDIQKTFADISHSKKMLGYNPSVKIQKGIPKFIEWYKNYQEKGN